MSDPVPQKPRFRPETFGKFTLFAPIATGGMGELFLANMRAESGFERLVVIKRILPHLTDKIDFVNMFVDEARVAAQIHHPNVCQILEFGQIEGRYYMALEYLEGVSLTQVIVGGRQHEGLRSLRFLVSLMSQTCEGLHFAHNLRTPSGALARVVHRDVNPKNIFITSAGVSKVIDFGIVKALGAINVTRTGSVKGTYSYMSPEQIKATEIDRRSDVFSLGTVTWEAVTGVRLFKRENDFHTWRAITEDPIPPPSQFREDLPRSLDEVLLKALERDRDKRYSTARELAVAIEAAIAAEGGPLTPVAVASLVETTFRDEFEMQRRRMQHNDDDVPDNWEGLTEVDLSVTPSAHRARPELFDNRPYLVEQIDIPMAGIPVGSQPITGSGVDVPLFGSAEVSASDAAASALTSSASDIPARLRFGTAPEASGTDSAVLTNTGSSAAAPARRRPVAFALAVVFLLAIFTLSAVLYLTHEAKGLSAGGPTPGEKANRPGGGKVAPPNLDPPAVLHDAGNSETPGEVDGGLSRKQLEARKIAREAKKKLEAEKLEAEKLEAERLEAEKLEAEKLDTLKLDFDDEKLEADRLKEKREKEKREKEKREREKEKREKEKREKEKLEKEALANLPPGFINVASNPFGTVYIDGKGYGPTPLVKQKLSPGKHSIKVVSSVDGTSKTRSVTIKSGAVERVKIEF